jgi:hypothetical protein
MTILTEDEFIERFRPYVMANGDLYEYRHVVNESINHVWTVVEAEDDEGRCHLIASPGFHVVNKVGYIMTFNPWVTGEEDAYWFYDDRDPDESDDDARAD